MKNNKLEDVAKLIVQLTSEFGLELGLALDDYAGPQHYLYFFEQPCSTSIRDFLLAKRFTQRHQPRTPHDAEAEIFINDDLSARIWFSDPAKNPDKQLWAGKLPDSDSFRAFQEASERA